MFDTEKSTLSRLSHRHISISHIVITLFLAVFLLCTFWGFRGVKQALYEEQASNLMRIMEKISQNMDTLLTDKWQDVEFLSRELSSDSYDTEADFLEQLARVQNSMSEENGTVLVIDSKGICHGADGSSFRWTNNTLLNTREKAVWVTNIPVVEKEVDSMLFTARLPDPIPAGDNNTFTHVVMVTDMRSLDDFLMLRDYGDESATYIIHATGGHVYRQEVSNALSNMYNIVATLEQCAFGYGTDIASLKDDLAHDRSGCAYVTIKGIDCYLVYERLTINDWYAVMAIPAQLASGTTTGFMRYIMIFMAFTCIGLSVIIISYLVLNQWERSRQDEQIKAALQKTAAAMRKAAEAEKSANEAKTSFLSSMSHDIRTPMNAIIGLTALAATRVDDPVYIKDCLSRIAVSSDYLLTLINDVLDISKVESGKISLNPVIFSLAELATNLTNIIRPQLEAKNHSFDIRIHTIRYEHLIGDELRINQIFMNLLTNAVKYTPPGGKVAIDLREEDLTPDRVRLKFTVADNGIGMSEEFQKHMYDTFARATDSRINEIQGTGLGLAICKQMVNLMNGSIECHSAINHGTTFAVTLDLEKSGSPEDTLVLPPIRLLLADDDEIFLESAIQTLSEMGTVVDAVSNGARAVELVRQKHAAGNDYPLVIIDWKMPGLDGIHTIRQIREVLGEQVPILLVSAYDWTQIEQQALSAGATGFISKPFFRSSVYREISHYLKGNNTASPKSTSLNRDLAGMRLLVAEDIELNYEIISDMLQQYGIETVRAANGRLCVNALCTAAPGSYDMILMDIQMPEMNGLEATRVIRSSDMDWVRTIPIIAMTADAFAEDVRACLAAGMDSHVSKPVDLKKLFRELRRFRGTRHEK